MTQRPAEYFRRMNKINRAVDKELGNLYRNTIEALPGESFLEFKRRMKNTRLCATIAMSTCFGFQFLIVFL